VHAVLRFLVEPRSGSGCGSGPTAPARGRSSGRHRISGARSTCCATRCMRGSTPTGAAARTGPGGLPGREHSGRVRPAGRRAVAGPHRRGAAGLYQRGAVLVDCCFIYQGIVADGCSPSGDLIIRTRHDQNEDGSLKVTPGQHLKPPHYRHETSAITSKGRPKQAIYARTLHPVSDCTVMARQFRPRRQEWD
jgi:hypothetical protein